MARVKQQTTEKSKYGKQDTISRIHPEPSESRSSISLDYSTDGSSAFLTLDGSSLIGGQFAGDGSVFLGPNSTAYPAATTASAPAASKHLSPRAVRRIEEEENDAASYSMSVQDSTSSVQSVVPTDEELFSIGGAKAIDPKS